MAFVLVPLASPAWAKLLVLPFPSLWPTTTKERLLLTRCVLFFSFSCRRFERDELTFAPRAFDLNRLATGELSPPNIPQAQTKLPLTPSLHLCLQAWTVRSLVSESLRVVFLFTSSLSSLSPPSQLPHFPRRLHWNWRRR